MPPESTYTLKYRLRHDRPDNEGRVPVFADVYWPRGRYGDGTIRVNGIRTGVQCRPENWMPTRRMEAAAQGKRVPSSERLIHTSEKGSLALNLRLERIQTALSTLFTKAAGDNVVPTPEEVREVFTKATPTAPLRRTEDVGIREDFIPTPDSSMHELLVYWRSLNTGILAPKTLGKYNTVPDRMNQFAKGITCRLITREWVTRYVAYLYDSGLHDASVQTNYKWLREAFRLVGMPVPRYLVHVKFRTGTKPVLLPEEFQALMALDLRRHPDMEAERDVFVFQTLMLLRDVDVQELAPHRAAPLTLAQPWGQVTGLRLTQSKTDMDVWGVMPPAAEAIWQRYQGQLPVVTNQERNRRIKEVAMRAKLNREVAITKFAGPVRNESVQPLRKVIASHMARHTGATFILQGSHGDRDLKEIALGHASDVYAPSDVYLYGPKILMAWQNVLSAPATESAPES